MEPKLNLDEFEDIITISNPGVVSSGTISTTHISDTITLSSPTYIHANTTISGGGHTVPSMSISAGSGITYPYLTSTGVNPTWTNSISPKIKLDGEGADIEVNGESLVGMIRKIEERLNILHPNQKLEAEWEELRKLGEQYRALEAKLQEQGKMWAKLKAMSPPEID